MSLLGFEALGRLALGQTSAPSNQQSLLQSAKATDADTFYTPALSTGAVTLRPSLFTDADTFYTSRVKMYLTPSKATDPDTFYTPAIQGGRSLFAPLVENTSVFYTPVAFYARSSSVPFKFERRRTYSHQLPIFATMGKRY